MPGYGAARSSYPPFLGFVRNRHVFDLKAYGVKGDANYLDTSTGLWYVDSGHTTPATDNRLAIQAALDDLKTAGGGLLLAPPPEARDGRFYVSVGALAWNGEGLYASTGTSSVKTNPHALQFDGDYLDWIAEGGDFILATGGGQSAYQLFLTGSNNGAYAGNLTDTKPYQRSVHLYGVGFDCQSVPLATKQANAISAIQFQHVRDFSLLRYYLKHPVCSDAAILTSNGSYDGDIGHGRVYGEGWGSVMHLDGGRRIVAHDLIADSIGGGGVQSNNDNSIQASDFLARDWKVTNIPSGYIGIKASGGARHRWSNIELVAASGATSDIAAAAGYHTAADESPLSDMVIDGLTIRGNGGTTRYLTCVAASGSPITNMTVQNSSFEGAASRAVDFSYAQGVLLTHNHWNTRRAYSDDANCSGFVLGPCTFGSQNTLGWGDSISNTMPNGPIVTLHAAIAEDAAAVDFTTASAGTSSTLAHNGHAQIHTTDVGGARTLSATTPIQAGTVVGQRLVVINSGAYDFTIPTGGNVAVTANLTVNPGDALSLIWTGSVWALTTG